MLSSCRLIPDSADSIGYGTSTPSASVRPMGGESRLGAPANSQTPLRFSHSERTSCGRGYSGRALVGDTWLVHGVVSWNGFGCQVAAEAGGATATAAVVATSKAVTTLRTRRKDGMVAPRLRRGKRMGRAGGAGLLSPGFRSGERPLQDHDDEQERAADHGLVVAVERADLVDDVLDDVAQPHADHGAEHGART